MGCMGKIFWDCAMLVWGCLADEPNTGKGKYQGDLGGTGVVERQGYKRGRVHEVRCLVITLVWPCSVHDQSSLSCFLTKHHSQLFF